MKNTRETPLKHAPCRALETLAMIVPRKRKVALVVEKLHGKVDRRHRSCYATTSVEATDRCREPATVSSCVVGCAHRWQRQRRETCSSPIAPNKDSRRCPSTTSPSSSRGLACSAETGTIFFDLSLSYGLGGNEGSINFVLHSLKRFFFTSCPAVPHVTATQKSQNTKYEHAICRSAFVKHAEG